jgi:hypothetical protein
MIKDNLKLKGRVAIVLRDAKGEVKQEQEIHNLVVDSGLDFIASRMGGASSDVMSHMAVGAGTVAANAADTTLGSELGRSALTSATVTDNQIAYVASFPAGTGTGAVTEAGIFNDASAGDMLCRTVFDVVNKQADDSLQITWTVTLTAS